MYSRDTDALVRAWRNDIPLLNEVGEQAGATTRDGKKPLIYLDSSATLLKSQQVIDSVVEYYSSYPSNIHRGSYEMSIKASDAYVRAREIIKQFFNADESYELIFTSGMTGGSNFLAQSHRSLLGDKDAVSTSVLEHHSSSLPWRELAYATGTEYQEIDILHSEEDDGKLDMQDAELKISKSKILSICGMSNVSGYVPPLYQLLEICQTHRCRMIVDACQLAVHQQIDLQKTPFDALLCSAHKLGGPTGIGALCIKKEWLETLPVVFTGGGTVEKVEKECILYHNTVERYEAGTPNVAGVIGFARAVEYLQDKGWEFIGQYEYELRLCVLEQVKRLKTVRILGRDDIAHSPIVSFIANIHPQDIAFILQRDNICVRDGKLCAETLLNSYGCTQVTRVSAFCYNTKQEIEFLGDRLESINTLMG